MKFRLAIKTMKRFAIFTVLFLLVGIITYGQEKQSPTNDNYKYGNAIDVAYEVSFPMGNLNNGADRVGLELPLVMNSIWVKGGPV